MDETYSILYNVFSEDGDILAVAAVQIDGGSIGLYGGSHDTIVDGAMSSIGFLDHTDMCMYIAMCNPRLAKVPNDPHFFKIEAEAGVGMSVELDEHGVVMMPVSEENMAAVRKMYDEGEPITLRSIYDSRNSFFEQVKRYLNGDGDG
jgi:hypothetical protein